MSLSKNLKTVLVSVLSLHLFGSLAFADTPKYSVDSSNYTEYSDMLSDGQIKAFETYDTFRIDVYANTAECQIPDHAKSTKNATMINGNEGLSDFTLGTIPFPNPTHGQHYIWNHRMTGPYVKSVHRTLTAYIVKNDGSYTIGQGDNYIEFPGAIGSPIKGKVDANIHALYMVKNESPPRIAGTLTMLHDFIDAAVQPRKAWQYSPATRRVRRAPNVNYDSFIDATGGLATIDSYNMFTGAQDRFNWNVIGKKVILIPHNNTEMAAASAEMIVSSINHPNPDLVRYEEKEVVIVEASLKEGSRHIFPRNLMYVTQDPFMQIMIRDQYDGQGTLLKHQFATRAVDSSGGCRINAETTLDFPTRGYVMNNVLGAGHDDLEVTYNTTNMGSAFYSPDGLRRFAR